MTFKNNFLTEQFHLFFIIYLFYYYFWLHLVFVVQVCGLSHCSSVSDGYSVLQCAGFSLQ